MPSDEWWHYLNTNEQLALAVRSKLLGVARVAASIAKDKAQAAIRKHKELQKKRTLLK